MKVSDGERPMSAVLFRTMMTGENDPIGSEKVTAVREALIYCVYIGSSRNYRYLTVDK